jgi:hypothetical protein
MEILVSCTLLAMMGALVWSSFTTTLDSKERVEAITDRMDEVRIAMNRMAREISFGFISQHFGKEERRTKTLFKEGSGGTGDKLTFSAFAHQPLMENANESNQTVISYFIDTDPELGSGKSSVFRRFKRRIDADPELEEGTTTEALCTDVRDLKFEHWNDATGEWKEEWDTEGIDTPTVLPKRVRITMVAKDVNGQDLKLTTQTAIVLWQMLNF